ncbi:pyridoxal phosphate-dependent aminotransferase [Actinoplanes sp. N902-109]|uniref:pyridoxal phosphate-dependent aminotransferase n=1 Tax=Actinoplanes sp. (strain N902-109) TaxID=649831 RepID=UPI0003294110|nr:pyridoxal phosphate-dependent aminotransferase [Actinoplanes sp. N902-109]AGL19074.1 class I and II aminotransferase [Actinoplanes sp. N902-109]
MIGTRARFSQRALSLRGSSLVELFLLARARGAVDLAVGTPAFPVPPGPLIDAAVSALRTGHNQYENPNGEAALRGQIARSLSTPADPDTELTVTAGGTEALCLAVLATVDPGDEVIVLEPYYENFIGAITLAGGVPRPVPLHRPDWRLDPVALAAAFGPRTRAVILNTPSNPTGRMLTLEELDEIAELCECWDTTVISDEVYARLVFDDRIHLSVADVPRLRPRSIVVGSLSKSVAVSGWRLGYLRAAPEYTRVLRRVHEVTTNGTAAPLQYAAGHAAVLTAEWWHPATELAARRDMAVDMLRAAGLDCRPAEGGCFLLADISGITGADCHTYVRDLLDERAVLMVPGTAFFADPADGHRYVRVAFNRTQDTLRTAARHLLDQGAAPCLASP